VMQWRRQKATGSWVEDNPPLPKWARESSGFVPAERFIRMWVAAPSLSALKQELFWMSLEDIESQAMLLSDWLEDSGFAPLSPKLLWESAPLSDEVLAGLVAEGLIALAEEDGSEEDISEDEASEEDSFEEEISEEDTAEEEPAVAVASPAPEPARPDEDPDRDYVPFSLQHPSDSVGIGVLKVNKP
jgi:hypothetical protein